MNFGRWFHSQNSFDRSKAIAGLLTCPATRQITYLVTCLSFLSACAMPLDSPKPQLPPVTGDRPPFSHRTGDHTDVLLFSGASSWSAEVDSLARILLSHGTTYQEVTSAELDGMSTDEISKYSLLIVPGGNAPVLTGSLSAATHAKLRTAVQERGLDYLGFCAGAWAAIAPAPEPGKDTTYGLGVVNGPIQQPNYLEKQGLEFAISHASFPNGTQRDLLWYGGPMTPDLPGGVVAKYADGTPAVTQIWSGQGFVIVSGLHPAINPFILNALGLSDTDAIDPEFAWQLIEAGLRQIPLQAF